MSNKFASAPLDMNLSVDQLHEWHSIHSANAFTFVFPSEAGRLDNITWRELGDAILRGIDIIIHNCVSPIPSPDNSEPMVVGILANANIISYTAFLFSHMRLTHPASGRPILPFPLSTRNSPAAIAHLLQITGVKCLWVTQGPMRDIAEEALGLLNEVDIPLLDFPSFQDLFTGTPFDALSSAYGQGDFESVDKKTPAVILHSSGSTAFPKPILLSHATLLENAFTVLYSECKFLGETVAVHSNPMFHAMGILGALWALLVGYIRGVPSPYATTSPMTPESYLEHIVESKSSFVYCVPANLETWSSSTKSIRVLKMMNGIFWAGGPLNPAAGNLLQKEGVFIASSIGGTEFGTVSVFPYKPYDEGHEWFKFVPFVSYLLIPEPGEDNVFELAFKETETHHLSAHNTEIDGSPAYTTNDLIERHHSNHELFKIRGRKDDQIMLSSGEKTNPGPLENIVVKDPYVKTAIMFGRGRFSNGILIEPTSYAESEQLGVAAFRNLIWNSVEEANQYAPTHSRIFKEMILIASASKPFLYTAKSTPRKGLILDEYATEIENIYKAAEDSIHSDIHVPVGSYPGGGWDETESLEFVRQVIREVMTVAGKIEDDDDIFGLGCDSIQATYIRNTLLHGLRQVSPQNARNLPSNFVYQHPTIGSLAIFVANHTRSIELVTDADAERKGRLERLIHKYTQNWPVHTPRKNVEESTGEVILLTGSTGALGSQILAQLVVLDSVCQIYAFNRPSQKTSNERHLEAFLDRGNDVSLLHSKKIVYIEGDISVEGFRIEPKLLDEIRDSTTAIIHNAWRVDFNLSLASFEPAVKGVRHLIDLALRSPRTSPPRVLFTSSIGIVKSYMDLPIVAEAPITDLRLINAAGYSESKWISEQFLYIAKQNTPLKPIIVRVGQLAGGLNGSWNAREWFPALVRAGQVVKGLPDHEGFVSFVPLHIAASAMIELRHASITFAHVVHPRPVSWRSIIKHMAEALNIPIIPFSDWLSRLEGSPRSEDALRRNPALHLIDFYRSSIPPDGVTCLQKREVMGVATYDTAQTLLDAPSLYPARLSQLGKEDVLRWIEYWKAKGALDA